MVCRDQAQHAFNIPLFNQRLSNMSQFHPPLYPFLLTITYPHPTADVASRHHRSRTGASTFRQSSKQHARHARPRNTALIELLAQGLYQYAQLANTNKRSSSTPAVGMTITDSLARCWLPIVCCLSLGARPPKKTFASSP